MKDITMAAARPGALSPSRTRPSTFLTASLAAAALALGGVAVPAAGTAGAPAPSSLGEAGPDENRDAARIDLTGRSRVVTAGAALGASRTGPSDVVRLEATPTVQEGTTTTARTPQVVKREARLWMNRTIDYWPVDELEVGSVDLLQDVKAKRITASVTYSATPTAALNSLFWVYLGAWDAKEETCTTVVALVGAGHGSASDVGFGSTNGSTASVARSTSGSTLTLTATGAAAAHQGYGCAFAVVESIIDPATSFVEAVENASKVEKFWASGADHFKAEMEKAPEFDFYASALHAAYPGKWNKVRINIENDGNLTAKKVKVKLSGKGLTFKKKTISLGTIKPGKDKDAVVQVKLKGKKTRTLNVKASATGKWSAKTSTKVGYRPHPKKLKSLVGQSYWAAPFELNTGWNVLGLTFVNKTWVYQGVPPKGTPKCSSKVKKCKKYSYSASTGKLKVGKMQAKVDSEGIQVTKVAKKGDAKAYYTPLKSPKKNSRITASLTYQDFDGCGLTFSCSTWKQHLTLKKNGKFSWTYSATHSSGIPPYQTFVVVTRPTKNGTYKILSKSRIQLSYVDGETGKKTKEIHTIGIDSNELGKHSPKYGLLIGSKPHL